MGMSQKGQQRCGSSGHPSDFRAEADPPFMSQHCCCSMAQVKASYLILGPQYPSQDGMGMETHCIY